MDDRERTLLTALGIIRAGVGGALVAAPGFAGRIWVGPGADGPGSLVFARALGARDVVLGSSLLAAVQAGDTSRASGLARLGVLADVADVAASLVAGRHFEGPRRWLVPLVAGAVGAAGVAVWSITDEPEPSRAEELGIVDQQDAMLAAAQD